VPDDDYW